MPATTTTSPAPTATPAPVPPRRVLSTLNADGKRRWLDPRPSKGRFRTARAVVAYALIALYTLIPFIRINGHPAIQLDLAQRKFHILGATFLSTDTVLMAVLALAIGFTIFFVTALFGRIWCGWGCPQTVYLEFVYRPIERLFKDRSGKCSGWRFAAKHAAFLLVSLHLANTFLSYFVGTTNVSHWVWGSPLEHPAAFILVAAITGLMMFDFAYFREQTCIVACPYGRLQSAMLDRHSLIITYDTRRGEPRRPTRSGAQDIALKQLPLGDCINCAKCVTTCPTGIDIRDGLQMECIGCAQCIDACDAVMDAVKKPRGLIRYTSQAVAEGQARSLFRARTIIYPVLLTIAVGIFMTLLLNRSGLDVDLLPRQGSPFYVMPDQRISNQIRLSLANRTDMRETYTFEAAGVPGVSIVADQNELSLASQESRVVGFAVVVPPEAMGRNGACDVQITVRSGTGRAQTLKYHMLGPAGHHPAPAAAQGATP